MLFSVAYLPTKTSAFHLLEPPILHLFKPSNDSLCTEMETRLLIDATFAERILPAEHPPRISDRLQNAIFRFTTAADGDTGSSGLSK